MQRHFQGTLCGFPGVSDGKESTLNAGDLDSIPGSGSSPGNWRREWLPPSVFLPGESHGQKSLAGYSPWCCKESDTTEQLILGKTESLPWRGNYSPE